MTGNIHTRIYLFVGKKDSKLYFYHNMVSATLGIPGLNKNLHSKITHNHPFSLSNTLEETKCYSDIEENWHCRHSSLFFLVSKYWAFYIKKKRKKLASHSFCIYLNNIIHKLKKILLCNKNFILHKKCVFSPLISQL